MKRMRHFVGISSLITDKNNVPIIFSTDARNENQGLRAIKWAMNKKRGCVPEAFIPIDLREEIVKTSHS